MDDLLQRMLAIDQEAEKIVHAAETEAAKIAEEARLEVNKKRAAAQAVLTAESDKLLQQQNEKCKANAEAELKNNELELHGKQEEFAQRIGEKKAELLRVLMALG